MNRIRVVDIQTLAEYPSELNKKTQNLFVNKAIRSMKVFVTGWVPKSLQGICRIDPMPPGSNILMVWHRYGGPAALTGMA
jgi:hypothetical protein